MEVKCPICKKTTTELVEEGDPSYSTVFTAACRKCSAMLLQTMTMDRNNLYAENRTLTQTINDIRGTMATQGQCIAAMRSEISEMKKIGDPASLKAELDKMTDRAIQADANARSLSLENGGLHKELDEASADRKNLTRLHNEFVKTANEDKVHFESVIASRDKDIEKLGKRLGEQIDSAHKKQVEHDARIILLQDTLAIVARRVASGIVEALR
jgi:hypothetical protein